MIGSLSRFRKLRPIDSIKLVAASYPENIEINELTDDEAQLPKFKFAQMLIRQGIEGQNKLIRRAKPRMNKTNRDREIESWKI